MSVTGLDALKRQVDRLPDAVTDACRKVARDTALRVRARAVQKVPVDSGITRDSIVVTPHVEEKRYRVEVGAAPPHRRDDGDTAFLPMLPVWLEFGTKEMGARPFMRPAGDAESERYIRDMTSAVNTLARRAID